MTPERWQRVKRVLQEALERDRAQQSAFVAAACAGDEGLRGEVESLLAYREEESADVIEKCAAEAARRREDSGPEAAGRRVGSYEIVREIGRGGMGAVYEAVRADGHYRQRVAVKFVRPGAGDDLSLRRFRAEMQILAGLNHPNIARLLDAGTTDDGRPFLVMEYVDGLPADAFCDERRLSTAERLRLFCTICEAVSYAHQRLVIHRDLKPGNILVTADGVPKLLDFGIAKLLDTGDQPGGVAATATALRQMTPEYASPEQVRGETMTTATDVYSLGVLLFELLSGRRPYRFASRLPHEVARAVCEQEPQRPSVAAVAVCGLRSAARETADGGAPQKPSSSLADPQSLRGDLDNIVLMALRKEPERRYASVEQFAEDVRRHLEGLPVRARADALGYRAWKFIRRHKVGVAAACVVAAALLTGMAAALWQARVARAERARAERRFDEVRQLANSFVFEVHDEIQNLPGSTRARSLIVQRALTYLDSLAREADDDHSLQRELAAAYERLGVVQNTPTVAHLGDRAGAVESHRKAAALREALVAAEPSNAEYRRELLDSYWHLGVLVGAGGDLPRALRMSLQQLAGREQLSAADPSNLADRYNLAATHSMIGVILLEMGDAAGAVESQRRALAIREELASVDPSPARARRALGISYEHLGVATLNAGDPEGALALQRRGLEVRETLLSADPLNTDLRLMLLESHRYVGDLLAASGDADEAATHYGRQLALSEEMAAADAASAQFRSNLSVGLVKAGDTRVRAGDAGAALRHYHRALRIREELAKVDASVSLRRDLAEAHAKVGEALSASGAGAEALSHYAAAAQTLEALSASAPAHVSVRVMLGEVCAKAGGLHAALAAAPAAGSGDEHWREARAWYGRSLAVWLDLRARGADFRGRLNSPEDPAETALAEIARCDVALAVRK